MAASDVATFVAPWRESSSCRAALSMLAALPVDRVFSAWLERGTAPHQQQQQLMSDALSLRARLELRCHAQVTGVDHPPVAWHIHVFPFAREDISVMLDDCDDAARAHAVALASANDPNPFHAMEPRDGGASLYYRHFEHDDVLDWCLQRGVGLLMLVATLQHHRVFDREQLRTLRDVPPLAADTVARLLAAPKREDGRDTAPALLREFVDAMFVRQ
jgi:hypothetical protein